MKSDSFIRFRTSSTFIEYVESGQFATGRRRFAVKRRKVNLRTLLLRIFRPQHTVKVVPQPLSMQQTLTLTQRTMTMTYSQHHPHRTRTGSQV